VITGKWHGAMTEQTKCTEPAQGQGVKTNGEPVAVRNITTGVATSVENHPESESTESESTEYFTNLNEASKIAVRKRSETHEVKKEKLYKP